QAAIAIDNARLFQERERRITELAILNEIGRALSATLERDQVTRAIYEQVGRILDTTNFYIALYDEERREWETVLDVIGREMKPPARYSVEQGLTGYIIRNRQPLLFHTSAELEAFEKTHGYERIGERAKSWLGVPMIAADKVVGVIGVESYEHEYAYTEDDLAVLSTVAAQAAVALENARLFGETRQRLQQVNTLLEVSRDVATRLDLPTLLQSILEAAVRSVPAAERGSILLLDEPARELVVAAQIGYPDEVRREVRLGLDEGFAGWVCREGRADIVVDAQTDPRFLMTETSRDIRSIMSAPLIGRRGLVGVINLDNLSRPGVFGRQDLEFLSGLAHQAAVAIENARLFEERERYARVLEARVRELSALLEGTRAITSTLKLEEVLDTLVGVVGRQMEVATVALWRVEGESLVPAAALGLPERFMREVRLRVGEGLSGHVAATGEVLAVPDVAQLEPELRNPAGAAFDQELDLHAYLGVPITYQERVLGVLSVMAHKVRDFTPEEVALLTGLAEQAGIAVENARLFQEREQRIAELIALNEVGRAISTTMRLDELLETIRREAARLVDTSNFLVALYDERTNTLSFPLYHEFGRRVEMPSRPFGNGLTEYVIRQRAPVLISGDTEAFCREHGIEHRGNPAKSWLAVPLIYMDRVIGIMALQDYEHVGAYDEHHIRLLSTLAGQAAVAIENARLFSDLEASRTELEARLIQLGALQEVARTISGTLELDTVLDAVLEAVTATLGFSYAVISLVDEEAGEVRAVRGIGVSPEQIAGSRRTLDSPDIMADIVRTGHTEVIDGWDERFDREMYEKFGHARLVRVFAPLVARGKAIGLIEAGYPRDVRAAITQDDVEVLQMFLAQAAIAVDNARLFAEIRCCSEELERMVEARTRQLEEEKSRLEALHAITTELSSTLDLDEILLKTIDLASVATGRSLGMILLRDPAGGDLVCRARLDEGNVLRPGRQVIPLAEAGDLRKVLEERATLRIDDVSRDPRGRALPLLPAGTRSIAAVPLVSAEEVVGIILLTHSQAGFFDEDQMRLLSTLGGEVATAIHNAELYSYINDQALRLSEMLTYQQEEASKVRAILQSIADGVIVVDRENRIILANPASQQILGMAREELEGRFTDELPGLFQPGGLFAQENPRFELMERYINVSSTPVITDAGETLGRVYVLRDITREVEADRAKSEFISTVSHELRTPLTSIKGYVDLILLGSVGEITPMQRNFLEVVRSNSNRLVDLINDLLDISRIETGRITLSPEPLSIFDVVEEVVESARAEIERKQLTLEVRVPPDLPLVHADRKRITQVLTNLVSNAYKYTREGGRVEISARCENGFLTVSVSDTGVGISKEDQKKLFTRFFRADNPLRDEVGGTGLGLAISKSFVEMHGGKMWVESELNVGSTFSFSLPLTQPPAGRREEREEVRPAGTAAVPGARILVVDDEPNITELLRYQLERAGYRVYTARRGEEALAIARQEHPDLITLDILMAGMDGQKVLERLKADERTADIPVVIISIVAEKENLMALGAVDFLPKPLEEAELLLTVGRILGRPGESATVLVADDDPDIVGWLRRVLEEQGYQVYEAADGETALETTLAVLPDLIVLDLRMPKMDGREVITRLKLREETCEIPIIVITASSVDRETDRVQILGLGAEGFLTKPFPAEHLIREIEKALRKKTEAAKE
ncbi:MAG: GAF domain-containing protein, partial [Chloroflexia bacterium]